MGNKQVREKDTMHLRSMIRWDRHVAIENESVEIKEYNKNNLK